ncbi:TetR/AcrR family transcriptional regulator [Spirochaetia bacterium]|nr:TetR/AcrR family transcriptional regulator [Spirochaetia bacterium]
MEHSIDDRRTRKTKGLIKQALVQLLAEKDIKDISVSELSTLADINRGTFYLHYTDIYDLFGQVEQEVLNEFSLHISNYKENSQVLGLPILLNLFKYIKENAKFFKAILHTKETNFLSRVIEMSRPRGKAEFRQLYKGWKEEYFDYYYDFMAFGAVAMVRHWFEKGMPETPEYMAHLAEKMIKNCIENAV